MIDEYFEEEEIMFDIKGNEGNSQLPSLVRRYVEDAVEVSKYNDIPATLTFFNLLGQIMKDKVTIVRGKGREDTRVPVLWLQTSGTGKTEMFNFYGKVSDLVFELLNSKYENEPTINDVTAFDIFDFSRCNCY